MQPTALIQAPEQVDNCPGTSLTFEYYTAVVLERLQPSVGPSSGNFNVTLIGRSFASPLVCGFGRGESAAIVLRPSVAVCMAPPQPMPARLAIRLSRNAVDFAISSQK